MKATITVDKAELRKKLAVKISEVETNFDNSEGVKAVREAISILEKGENGETFGERMQKWHQEVADGIRNNEITFTNSGKLKGAPVKPVFGKIKLDSNAYYYGYNYDLKGLRGELKRLEMYRDQQLKPLTAALDLLDMAHGAQIEIEAADYQSLLSQNSERYYY